MPFGLPLRAVQLQAGNLPVDLHLSDFLLS
jgi:hypothetical protein